MADLIPFRTPQATQARERRRRRIEGVSFRYAAEHTFRLLRLAQGELPKTKQNQEGLALLSIAADDLEVAIEVHAEAARRELRETVLAALGPDLRVPDVEGLRKALKLLLDCLPGSLPGL